VILTKDGKKFDDVLKTELSNIDSKIKNIDKIKHLLLYDVNDLSIVDFILNKI
jgi:hypothetical protein